MNDASLGSEREPGWVAWIGGPSLEDPERDGPELERLLTQPPFTAVKLQAIERGVVIRAEFPPGERVLWSQALRILLERLLEHTGADVRTGPFHPRNIRQDEFLGDLRWDEELHHWSFVAGAGSRNSVSGKIRPPEPQVPTEPPLSLMARWWRGLSRLFGRSAKESWRELSARYRSVDIAPQLKKAREIVAGLEDFERVWRAGAADHLHELYNSNWSSGKPIDRNEFLSRIRLTSLALESDGTIKARFDDGELFLMHLIAVEIDANGKVTDAYLEG